MSRVRSGLLTLLLPLGACHLLQGLQVECVAGEACAGPVDDTGPVDTGGSPSQVGFAVSMVTDGGVAAAAFDAFGNPLRNKAWDGLGSPNDTTTSGIDPDGAIFYNAATGAGLIALGTDIFTLESGGGVRPGVSNLADVIYDLDGVLGKAWIAVGWGVVVYSQDGTTVLDATSVQSVHHVAVVGEELVFTDSPDGSTADIYAYNVSDDSFEHGERDFSTDPALGLNVFAGPDAGVYACTPSGTIFRVADLSTSTTPVVDLAVDANDVTDCAWDPGDDSWLAFSQSRGVLRRTPDGVLARVWTPQSGTTGMRADFFP